MEIGQNIWLKILKSIIKVVVDVEENDFHQLGAEVGLLLKQFYTNNVFITYSEGFINTDETVKNNEECVLDVVEKLFSTGYKELKYATAPKKKFWKWFC